MTGPIYASGLLRTAFNLAGVGAGAGRPTLADLRATSTSYYALFHQFVRHGAFDSLPGGSAEEIAEVARWFSHTGILASAGLVMESAAPKLLVSVKKADRRA